MFLKLVIQDDEGKTTIVPLARDEITIGRKEGNTIRLTERNVSRRHARILRNKGEVHIEDLGSYNGIRVNNARIAERVSLRVSDQVQIGDYKLYLKAEGAEQADEARTVPIERVDQQQGQAMSVSEAHTAPVANGTAPVAIHQAPTAPQLVGSPNRTMVALPDGDPTVRAVGPATAAAVAALTATAGYGKLVVLSSNFAGKEFELSRPQMIIGRTDENDIVVNHRSISRNHAKLTREPETGRYTISDLQSSNGVRVNGQDYGKVELRRGDVVDLGHVRLRFVDAGEDFVFARDAVITDVPDTANKRSMIVALVAAIAVVVAGIVVYVMRGGPSGSDKPPVVSPGTGTNGAASLDGGPEAIALGDHPEHPGVEPGAAIDAAPGGSPANEIEARCLDLQTKYDWQGVTDCSAELEASGRKDRAQEFRDAAKRERINETLNSKIGDSISKGALRVAQAQLRELSDKSVYYRKISEEFRKADEKRTDVDRKQAEAFARDHNCKSLKQLAFQLSTTGTDSEIAAVGAVKCTEKVAVVVEPVKPPIKPPGDGSGSAAVTKPACDSVDVPSLVEQAKNQYEAGFAGAALTLLQKGLACTQTIRMYQMAALYACVAKNGGAARAYFQKVPAASQPMIEQRCQDSGIDVRTP
jgi:ABC transport system ATP-binding/permease protein